jgi:hypothetical protein
MATPWSAWPRTIRPYGACRVPHRSCRRGGGFGAGAEYVPKTKSGNRFYVCFKKHILQGDYDRRDLYFFAEGHLAMWVVDSFDELNEDDDEHNNPSGTSATDASEASGNE